MKRLSDYAKYYYTASHWPEGLAPLLDVGLRIFLAMIWDSTLYLFSDVYQVPVLPPELAAYMATAGELALPVLLVVGLFGRFAAAGLFILNLVAVASYYSELSEAGRNQHWYWGLLLLVLLMMSNGRWSLDAWLEKRLRA
jgi:putative oxidoreductase